MGGPGLYAAMAGYAGGFSLSLGRGTPATPGVPAASIASHVLPASAAPAAASEEAAASGMQPAQLEGARGGAQVPPGYPDVATVRPRDSTPLLPHLPYTLSVCTAIQAISHVCYVSFFGSTAYQVTDACHGE